MTPPVADLAPLPALGSPDGPAQVWLGERMASADPRPEGAPELVAVARRGPSGVRARNDGVVVRTACGAAWVWPLAPMPR